MYTNHCLCRHVEICLINVNKLQLFYMSCYVQCGNCLHTAYKYFNFNQGKNIIVFYGSQTGTAEEFANRLSKDAQRYGMKGMAADPEEYDMVIKECMHQHSNHRIRVDRGSSHSCG